MMNATKYEVVAVNEATGAKVVVGFTARKTKAGLVAVAQQHGEALIKFLAVGEADGAKVAKVAGVWTIILGAVGHVRFSGETERHPSSLAQVGA